MPPFPASLNSRRLTPASQFFLIRLQSPKRAEDRTRCLIGWAQTGIYPLRSPGGWNLIGRTPLKLFDPTKSPPALLRAGDRVRFRAITREEFAAFAEATAAEESMKQ